MCDLNLTPILQFFAEHSGNFLAALGGAGFGSFSTYLFQVRREKTLIKESRFTALLEAKITISYHISSVMNIKKMIEKYRGKEDEGFLFPLMLSNSNRTRLDFNKLAFITYESKSPNLLMDLNLAGC